MAFLALQAVHGLPLQRRLEKMVAAGTPAPLPDPWWWLAEWSSSEKAKKEREGDGDSMRGGKNKWLRVFPVEIRKG